MGGVQKDEMKILVFLSKYARSGNWPLAANYKVVNGTIYPYGARGYDSPLEDQEVFFSFARLATRGNPSDRSILDWVRAYGLLRRRDSAQESSTLPNGEPNQQPESLESIRKEAQRAYDLLHIFELHRSENPAKLRERVHLEPLPQRKRGDFRLAEVYFDDTPTRHIIAEGEALTDGEVLDAALDAVRLCIDQYIAGVRPAFGAEGKLALRVPDLLSAMYWQFAAFVDGKKQLARCAGCGRMFTMKRRDQEVCKAGCRTSKMRKKREAGGRV